MLVLIGVQTPTCVEGRCLGGTRTTQQLGADEAPRDALQAVEAVLEVAQIQQAARVGVPALCRSHRAETPQVEGFVQDALNARSRDGGVQPRVEFPRQQQDRFVAEGIPCRQVMTIARGRQTREASGLVRVFAGFRSKGAQATKVVDWPTMESPVALCTRGIQTATFLHQCHQIAMLPCA